MNRRLGVRLIILSLAILFMTNVITNVVQSAPPITQNTILVDIPPDIETPIGNKLRVYISHKETIVLPKGEIHE